MAMLAEKKRKQKWSLNPRGKDWSEDSNKFGQKMLEKMGWSKGKGLGANENGITEHIKLSYKNDSKGMGYKESSDQWTEHEQNFSALLEALGGSDDKMKNEVRSLEKQSQTSRSRVHYHKFTRGKDLSRYSEKDLANIFGKKSLKAEKKASSVVDEKEEEVEQSSSFLINGGSMSDYFKKKLPNFGKINGYVIGNNGVLKKEDESEEECSYSGFGFKGKAQENKPTFVSYLKEEDNPNDEKKKRKRKLEQTINVCSPIKKAKIGEKPENLGLINPAFNPMHTPIKFERHSLQMIEESIDEEDTVSFEQSGQEIEVSVQINNEETPDRNKKDKAIEVVKKKKKRVIEVIDEEISVQNPVQKEKTKKKKVAEIVDDVENSPMENQFEVKIKKKRKKSKKQLEENGVENPNFKEGDQEESAQPEENPFEVKTKKKKRKLEETLAVDNPIFLENDDGNDKCEYREEFEVKRKEKKSKKRKIVGLTNPALNLNDSKENVSSIADDSCDLMLNIVSTPVQTESSATKRRKSVRFSDVNEERIIPNLRQIEETRQRNELFDINTKVISDGIENEEISYDMSAIDNVSFNYEERKGKKSKKEKRGIKNDAFDRRANSIEENVEEMAKKFDNYQAEVENDINEEKLRISTVDELMVGEVGNPEGENELLPCGASKLKFKHADFGKTPPYLASVTGPRKSYKHLIKGDIVVEFKGSNLHEVVGYSAKKRT